MNVYDLAVGDIVLLDTGCRVPADCVLLTGMDVVANEGRYHNLDVFEVQKQGIEDLAQNPDCFLLSHSLIIRGAGQAIVCAVGERSRRGVVCEDRLGISDEKTYL